MQIKPKIGLDNILLGMTREQVRALVGDAEQVSLDDDVECDESVAWYYWSRGISFHFDAEDEWRLGYIEVSAPSALLNGKPVIGLSIEEFFTMLRSEGVLWTEGEHGLVFVDEWDLDFWIEEGRVASVQWAAYIDDDDNEVWPPQGDA